MLPVFPHRINICTNNQLAVVWLRIGAMDDFLDFLFCLLNKKGFHPFLTKNILID